MANTLRALPRYVAVLRAALSGGEDAIVRALADLNESEASGLRNAMHTIAELAEQRRKALWRAGRQS